MATNYNTLIHSENTLFSQIIDYLKFSYDMHSRLWESYYNSDSNFDDFSEEIMVLEKEANNYEIDILDECAWVISKDQPRTNHLRYIMSIIYSAKDIKRICDYVYNISKNITNYNFCDLWKELIRDLSKWYTDAFEKLVEIIEKKDFEKTSSIAKDIKKNFFVNYQLVLKKLFLSSGNVLIDNFRYESFLILKCIDRTIDHVYNVFLNFRYIK